MARVSTPLRSASSDPHAPLAPGTQARFVAEAGRFQLLETAAQSIARLLLTAPAPDEERGCAQRVRVTLTKPDALPGSAVPSVSVTRDAEDEVGLGGGPKPSLNTNPNLALNPGLNLALSPGLNLALSPGPDPGPGPGPGPDPDPDPDPDPCS